MSQARLQVIRLTPPGRGAVASLRLLGSEAASRAAPCVELACGSPLAEQPLGRIAFARWGEAPSEEVVLCRLEKDVVEVHCHGSDAAVERILDQLCQRGFDAVPWACPDFLRSGNQEDAICATARIALAAALTRRTAAILLDQVHGALSRELDRIISLLGEQSSALASARLAALLTWAPLGLRLTRPWRIVLRGAPNVGKSSLANALLGYARAIVHPTPGTTRDVVTAGAALAGWPIAVADTAGDRSTEDPLEQAGIARARAAAHDADLVLEIHDAREAAPATESLRERPRVIQVFNKIDLLPRETPRPLGLAVSALTGEGLVDLERTIVVSLVPECPPPGAAVPFLPQQVDALRSALTAIAAGKLAQAADGLAGLTSSGLEEARQAVRNDAFGDELRQLA